MFLMRQKRNSKRILVSKLKADADASVPHPCSIQYGHLIFENAIIARILLTISLKSVSVPVVRYESKSVQLIKAKATELQFNQVT